MRRWIIRHWYFNYDSKVFGFKVGRHLRVVNTLIVLFCMAGLYNLFTEGFGIIDFLVFVPFLLIFFKRSMFIEGTFKYDELDWEQKFQYLKAMRRDEVAVDQSDYKMLDERFTLKYKGDENWVEAWRMLFPFLIILATLLIYWFFGEADPSFPDRRFF